jgi:hypothetical protein
VPSISSILRTVPIGDLVFANVIDATQRAAQGDMGESVVSVRSLPGRALPFDVVRAWKVPTGYVTEEIELVTPGGMVAHRIGPAARFMLGSMDLTHLETRVEEAVFSEPGAYLASFRLEGDLIAQVDFQVVLQPLPAKLPPAFEDGLKKSDVIWVGLPAPATGRRDRTVPAWFAYRAGKIYVLSKRTPGPEEQTVPGVPGADELVLITRRKDQNTSLERFIATARVLEDDEWEDAAKILVDRRRSRAGPPEETLERWRGACDIVELTPVVPA